MAGRDLHANVLSAVQTGLIRPVLIGRFDILADPLTAWSGPGTLAPSGTGDTALDGQIFVNLAPYIELTEVKEDQGIGGPTTLTVSGHDLDEDILRQILRDKRQWRGRGAWLWMGLLAADEATIIGAPARIKTGIMSQMNVSRDATESVVNITIDRDLGKANNAEFRWIDHQRLFPTDTFSTFVNDLVNKPEGFTNRGIGGGVTRGGGKSHPYTRLLD